MNFGGDLIKAYIKRYFKDDLLDELIHKNERDLLDFLEEISQQEVTNERKINVEFDKEALIKTSKSYKKIEFLGFDRIWKVIENTKQIISLALDQQSISSLGSPGQIHKLFPNLDELSLMENLFSFWGVLNEIQREFPNMKRLILGKNSLLFEDQIPEVLTQKICQHEELHSQPVKFVSFEHLKMISISHMGLTFAVLNKIKDSFKNVDELVLSHNSCNDFEAI